MLADAAGGKRSLAVVLHGTAPTVGDLLDLVARVHPNLERRLRTESGQLRRHVNVYADGADVRGAGGTGMVLGHNAVVMILPSVAGG